jgi:Protein of unknown function (DUF4054)
MREFASTVDYPSLILNYYIVLGGLLLNKGRFGPPSTTVSNPPSNIYDFVLELFVAHHVVLERNAQIAALSGGVPGEARGAVAGKSTGPISVNYAAGDSLDKDAGHWNDTEYGKRFWRFVLMYGAGAVQIGIGGWCGAPVFNGIPLNGPAWPGPLLGWGAIN